jgi:hypothetical protein
VYSNLKVLREIQDRKWLEDMLQRFQWGRVRHRKRHILSRTPKTSVIALSGITAITGQYVPLKQNAINTVERGARHQADVETAIQAGAKEVNLAPANGLQYY